MAESDLDYAKVTGRFALTVGDTDDVGDNPDIVYCDQGTVEFTPQVTFTKVAGATPAPFEAGNSVITATISDADYIDPTDAGCDGPGWLTYGGKPFVMLVDLTSDKVNPNLPDPETATHAVVFKNVKAEGTTVAFPPRKVRVSEDGPNGDGINDLVQLLPVVAGTSTPITVGPRGIDVVDATINEAGELVLALSDDSEVNAGEIPVTVETLAAAEAAAAAAVTATGAAGTATGAAGTATTKASEASTSAGGAVTAKVAAETASTNAGTAKVAAEAARDDLLAQKNQPSGIAPLDGSTKVPQANLPAHLDPTALSASTAAAIAARFEPTKEVWLADYGALFDRRPVTISTTASSTTVTSSDADWTADDVNKVVFIPGAGAAGTPYYDTYIGNIASVTNSTTAVLSAPATATVTDADGYVGTNNDTAWEDAFDDLTPGGGTIHVPAGDGIHATQKEPPDNIRVVGAGRTMTVIHPIGSVNGFLRVGDAVDPITNVHWADLTIDGDMQTNGDGAGAKGFGLYFQQSCSYTDVTVKNTAGSGFGNDTHADTYYVRCIAENCGRVGTTSSAGHSGFGFGMGGWAVDNVYLIDCIARDNMRHGVFFEYQPGTAYTTNAQPEGAQILGGRFEGNGVTGISDQNCTGLIVIGAHIVNNGGQGFSITTAGVAGRLARDGVVANCVITGNTLEGIDLAYVHANAVAPYGKYRVLDNLVGENGSHGIQVRGGTGYTVDQVEVRGNTARGNIKNGIRIAGGTFIRTRVNGNTCIDNGQGSDTAGGGLSGPDRGGISIQTVFTDGDISNNYCTDTRSSGKSQAYGILINASGTVGTVVGNSQIKNNELRGNNTQALGGVGQCSGATIVRGNTGMVGAVTTITLTGSPMTRTCGVQNEEHFASGGTVSAVSVNGTALGAIAPISGLVLTPGDTLTITYSSSPTWKYRTFQNES